MTAGKLLVLGLAMLCAGVALAADKLEQAFDNPPAAARPLTWWHWLNGNVTKQGITADLESMRRAGLGGCYLFNCGGRMPEGDVRFMQPKWLEMMKHTISEAQRLGLKFGVHNCDGFSQSGGPWITPEKSMKVLTWTATDATGPIALDAILPKGAIQEDFYRDVAVIAFPLPAGGPLVGATLRGSRPPAELKKLTDGDPETQATFPPTDSQHNIDFVFPTPRVLRSITVRNAAPHRWEEDFPLRVEASDDGQTFRPVGALTANWDFHGGAGCTAAFADTPGRVFRVAFRNPLRVQIGEIELSSAAKTHFAEAKAGLLRSRGHGAETRHHQAYPGPDRQRPLAANLIVAPDAIRDLTARIDTTGRLKWDVPAGRWRILRVGFTSNGHYVSPATPEGRGLECDKLDPQAVQFHLTQYVDKLLALAGPAVGKTFAAVEIDSWECGIQNWTAGFERRFRARNGYDLLPYLPALLEGWIVGDVDRSERVLWDWRRFLADQFSESYFAVAARHFREKGVTYVGESTGRQQYLYDVAYLRNSGVPMGEFWIDSGPGQGVRVDNKVASSIAHVAGRPIVASESYTSSPGAARWQNHPYSLKPEGDRAFCAGVNQFVFHTFAHQPYQAVGPGFTFFFWGLNFNRGNTWWDAADAWMAYLTRCNFLLREGQQVCDVLWFVGEDVPNRIAWRDALRPVLPAGYDFDGGDAAALLAARVRDGRVVLPSGAEYRLLLLPDLVTMRPAIAAKVLELVQAGATVLAPRRALQSPALADRGAGDAKVRLAMATLWGDGPAPVDRRVGQGRFFAGLTFEDVLGRMKLPCDFETRATQPEAEILYVHRRVGDVELYFLSNQRDRAERFEGLFRAGDKTPELWDPASGRIVRTGVFRRESDARLCVPLTLDPNGSLFVVFRTASATTHAVAQAPATVELVRDPQGALSARFAGRENLEATLADGRRIELAAPALPEPVALKGAWQVTFPPNLGAPPAAQFEKLVSWPERTEPGIRFFSGTATYRQEFELPAALFGVGRELVLDLGRVEVIARVTLNGRQMPTLWKPPFCVTLGNAARPGKNRLEIRVTNLWPNRMIGDAGLPDDIQWQPGGKGSQLPRSWPDWLVQGQPRPSGRIAFCTRKDVYGKQDPLLPSGLLGPVAVRVVQSVPLTGAGSRHGAENSR